ncbi:hypothetical protein I553_9076 [Mycobacterium xenopi 4042]|uniref:Glucose-methanol-choline oxidoreductase N-terminal domain-containing protein n=1 Tax=Mycobacterium xenopi 4042 TaxID=1299334 RepID=X8APC4_MYCXE|nr:hypothetical protein I553_9076 [Mycobacterium xenopi 4042]
MGLHPAEELDLAVAELNPREAEHAVWDVIVVGTGMGGGRWAIRWLGQAAKCSFSKRGARPCPVCQGRFALRSRSWPNRERVVPSGVLRRFGPAGRSIDEIEDISWRLPRRFLPLIGSGTGGSSAIYGMVCERFFVRDFTPRQNFRTPGIPLCRRRGRLVTSN